MKLLLIDDHKMIGESLKESLKTNRLIESIDVFVDPNEAIKSIMEKEFDIILMDINMGKASNYIVKEKQEKGYLSYWISL